MPDNTQHQPDTCDRCGREITESYCIVADDGRRWHVDCFFRMHPWLDRTVPTDPDYDRRLL